MWYIGDVLLSVTIDMRLHIDLSTYFLIKAIWFIYLNT